MSDIEIHVMDGWEDKLEADIETALEAVGLQAEGYAVLELENNPRRIDTGLLRNSITHAIGGKFPAKKSYRADKATKQKMTNTIFGVTTEYTANVSKSGTYQGTAPNDKPGQMSVYIGTNVEYAPYVHEGTSSGLLTKLVGKKNRMTPNRFLKNALVKHKDEYKTMIEYYLRS